MVIHIKALWAIHQSLLKLRLHSFRRTVSIKTLCTAIGSCGSVSMTIIHILIVDHSAIG